MMASGKLIWEASSSTSSSKVGWPKMLPPALFAALYMPPGVEPTTATDNPARNCSGFG
jgi:hypothetical protein